MRFQMLLLKVLLMNRQMKVLLACKLSFAVNLQQTVFKHQFATRSSVISGFGCC